MRKKRRHISELITTAKTVLTSSSELLPSVPFREFLHLRNDSANTIFVRGGVNAAVADATSLKIVSGAEVTIKNPGIAALQAIALTASSDLTVTTTRQYDDWTPLELFQAGEEGAWYDPSDLSTLFQDSAGTIPVLLDGDPIGRISDKSGNGNHLLQATDSKRPIFKKVGGLSKFRTDGISQYLSAASFPLQTFNTIALGVDPRTTAFRWFMEQSVTSNSNDGFFLDGLRSTTVSRREAASTHLINATASGWAGTTPLVASYTYDGTFFIFKDGVSVALDAPTGTARSDTLITDTLFVGSRAGTSIFEDPDIYGLVLVDGVLSTSDRVKLENYLARKTGVSLL